MDIQVLVVLTCHDDKKITDSVEIIQSWADHNNVKITHRYDKVQTKHVPCGAGTVSAKRMDMLLIGPADTMRGIHDIGIKNGVCLKMSNVM